MYRGAELTAWGDAFLAAGEASLKTRPADGREVEIGRLKAKVGDLTMTTELLEATGAASDAQRACLLHRRGAASTLSDRHLGNVG